MPEHMWLWTVKNVNMEENIDKFSLYKVVIIVQSFLYGTVAVTSEFIYSYFVKVVSCFFFFISLELIS